MTDTDYEPLVKSWTHLLQIEKLIHVTDKHFWTDRAPHTSIYNVLDKYQHTKKLMERLDSHLRY